MSHRSRISALAPAIAVLAGCVVSSTSVATWSIVVANKRTGEVAVGCATCLEGFDLQQGTPVIVTGRGGASAQSSVDVGGYNRTIIRDQLLQGIIPSTILTNVRTGDTNANNRQYGIATTGVFGAGGTYTGPLAAQWAGGVTGQFTTPDGEFVYAIQGNILTGANVVNDARDALVNIPGGLPEKLMAAMEAAQVGGGDGRCSCTTGGPTSCGSPPPVPFKSAHVGYMIVARAGDLDAGLAAYRAGTTPLGVAVADLNLDGSPDALTANNGSSNVSIFRNSVTAPSRFMRLNTAVNSVFAGGPRGIAVRDVTGDNRPDVFVTAFSGNQLMARPASTAGGVGAQTTAAVGAGPISVVVAQLDATTLPEVVTANYIGGSVSVVPITAALPTGITFGTPTTVATGGQLIALTAGDLDGDTDTDIVVADFTGSRLIPLTNNAGVLTPGTPITLAAGPADIVAADLDGDTDTDLVSVCQTDRSLFIVTNTAGVLTPARTPLPFAPGKVRAGDLNNDGAPDIAILGTSAFAVCLSQGGTLGAPMVYAGVPDVQSHQWAALELADMDRDGDLDLVVTQAVSPGGVALIENLGGTAGRTVGTFRAGVGHALGEYYLGLNVAEVQSADPDPVDTLRQQFDVWRAGLIGVPDAVRSEVIAPDVVQAGCPRVMTVTLRDWQGSLVTTPHAVSVARAAATGVLTIGSAVPVSAGVYEVTLSVGDVPASGEDTLEVRVNGAGMPRPVVLMPSPRVRGWRAPLTDIDFNNDSLFPDVADIDSYLCVYAGGACGCDAVLGCDSIDFNQDNLFPDEQDLRDFLDVFAGRACGG